MADLREEDVVSWLDNAWNSTLSEIQSSWEDENSTDDQDQDDESKDSFEESDTNLLVVRWLLNAADSIPDEIKTLVYLKFPNK